MLTIVCDACKKAIPGPEKQTGVIYILDKALCKSCEKKLLTNVSDEMEKHDKFIFSDYQDQYIATVNRMCK
ncbi:MAG: hypothetical protein K9M94_03435 [Spirochaetia bacterium]|nr:hypothetical protein [Spirochaetia bacterium]